jgi:hypothetical protein
MAWNGLGAVVCLEGEPMIMGPYCASVRSAALRSRFGLAVFCLGWLGFGQELNEVRGWVRVAGGLGVGGAQIQASLECGGKRAFADERGAFVLPSQLVKGCKLNVSADGFQATEYVVEDPAKPLEIVIAVDPLRQTVTVMDSSPLVSDNPEVSTAIDTRTLSELPSSIRDINRFAMLDPRVRNTGSLGTDGIYGTRLAVNGQLFRFTQYRMDGMTNYEPALGNGPQQILSIASVAEYKVLVNQFSAEYGRSGGGVISAITRTGGDQWHGEGFYFLRPSGIQAAPPVSIFRVPNERHMWGAAAGGPITPTFHLFASLEANKQTRGAYIQSPTPGFYPGHQNQTFGLVNMDKRWRETQSLYLRLNAHTSTGDNANDAVGGFNQPSAARRDSGQNIGLQATHRWIVRPTAINEIRVGASKSVPLSYYAVQPQTQIVRPAYSTEGLSDYFDTRVTTWQASDVLSWQFRSHQVKVGGDFVRNKLRDVYLSQYGSYRMAAGAPRVGENPVQYTQTFGAAPVRYGDTLASWFVQDDWKVLPRLTLNLGVRHDYQSTTGDANNVAPRFGFAWDVFGKGRTVVRGGSGVYYDQIFLQVVRGALQQGPGSMQATYTLPFGVAGFPTFPNSLTERPTGVGDRRDLAIFPENGPANRLSPYTGQFSFGVQQVVGRDWTVAANYSYNLSRKQLRVLDVNAPERFVRTAAGQRRTAAVADTTRPYMTYAGVPVRVVGLFENTGASRYSAFDIQVSRRFSRHFQFMAHYLNSSSITNTFFTGGPNTGAPSDWGNRGAEEHGPSDYYQRNRFTAQGIVELPWNVQVTGFMIAASGLPVNPLTGVDNNGDGNVLDRPVGLGRNSFRGPYQNTVDLSVMKRLVVTERVRAELRLEGTNLLNKSNFLRVNAVYGDGAVPLGTFLQPVAGLASSDPARQLQVGLRFTF